MLVLSRRMHEKIVLPDIQTTLQVVAIHGSAVRLGIEAPPELKVFREEVWERTAKEQSGPRAPPGNEAGQNGAELRELMDRWRTAADAGLSLLQQRVGAGSASELAGIVDTLAQELGLFRRLV
jgi:carbon storage regulator